MAAPIDAPPATLAVRMLTAYCAATTARPVLSLTLLLALSAGSALFGSGIQIRADLDDLFPDDTPAVVAARQARTTMKSTSQLVVVLGSPERQANHKLATEFCARVEELPEIASVECSRDVKFFDRNAALFLPIDELERIEADTRAQIDRSVRTELLGKGMMEGIEGGEDEAPAGDEFEDDFGNEFEDEDGGDDKAPGDKAAAGKRPAEKPAADAAAADQTTADQTTADKEPAAGEPEAARRGLPTEDEIRRRLGAEYDIRQWRESEDGTVLGVKLFPTIPPSDVEQSAAFMVSVRAIMSDLKPTTYHPKMLVSMHGDYAEMSAEVGRIKGDLLLTTALALGAIMLIQLIAFRQLRALILLFVPLVCGIALTLGFVRGSIGYLNVVTAFIFGILFGLGNDFGVYTLSRYFEERAGDEEPRAAVMAAVPGLWSAMSTAAVTTMAAFFALMIFDFRGFSQFGFIAGIGVLLALVATMAIFPPLAVICHRVVPEKPVGKRGAEGFALFGLVTRPRIAKALLAVVFLALLSTPWLLPQLTFQTNLRELRTPPRQSSAAAKKADPSVDEQRRKHSLGVAYRSKAEKRSASPILVVTDSMADSRVVHDDLMSRRKELTRLNQIVSIHTFVPKDQARKQVIIDRIEAHIESKIDMLHGTEREDAERALELLRSTPFTANDLPDFVRKRFLDTNDRLGRFVILYANGNLAEVDSIREVMDQIGHFKVEGRHYRAAASFFILAEADAVVRKEGPWAVLLAALAVLCAIGLNFRSLPFVGIAFGSLLVSFTLFLALASALGMHLNLFSITVLPSVFGIGIDGTVHLVHRGWETRDPRALGRVVRQVGGAIWIAALTTTVGFGAMMFQANPGVASIGTLASIGVLLVCTLSALIAGALLSLWLGRAENKAAA